MRRRCVYICIYTAPYGVNIFLGIIDHSDIQMTGHSAKVFQKYALAVTKNPVCLVTLFRYLFLSV